VAVSLTGLELTRRERPRFPVVRYLAERGWRQWETETVDDWRGRYSMRGAEHSLRLHNAPDDGDVVATLGVGRRLIALVSAGLLTDSRSPAEHKLLRAGIGRAAAIAIPGEPEPTAHSFARTASRRKEASAMRLAAEYPRRMTLE